jgi:NADH:ubiquinone oxidoreductase subunit 3 (subunit A)
MIDLIQPWHLIVILFILLPITAIVIVPYWIIFKKAGFQPALSILMFVPLVNIVILYVVAFSRWKLAPRPEQ